MKLPKTTGYLGISGISLFLISLIVFGMLNKDFQFMNDFISMLGAKGEPHALWWNLIGFLFVGVILSVFGFAYGIIIEDRLVGMLLGLFGLGFALTAIPMDMSNDRSTVSKAHIVAICLGLACWLFGLARIGYNPKLKRAVKVKANAAAILLVTSMIGFAIGIWTMPITHRLVFGIVFGWTLITSVELLRNQVTLDLK